MTKLLEQALRQIEELPDSEQDAAAGALLDYVKHMRDMRLTDAQVAEVRRRMADPDRRYLTLKRASASRGLVGSGRNEACLRRSGTSRFRKHLHLDRAGQSSNAKAVVDRLLGSAELLISLPLMGMLVESRYV
jgi:hypothetical protein